MFFKKKTIKQKTYDKAAKKPAVKSSICTGEKVAGFIDLSSGKFEDIMLLRNEEDLEIFLKMYGIEENEIERIW